MIDEAAAMAVFARYAAEGPEGEGVEGEHIPGSGAPPTGDAGEWIGICRAACDWLADGAFPGWDVPDDCRADLAAALAALAARMFPGGPPNMDRWGPWARLAWAGGRFVLAGVEWDTMTLKPRRAPVDVTPDHEPPPQRAHSTKGGFSTVADDDDQD